MSRKRKASSDDNTEGRKKLVRSFRNRERREQRKTQTQGPEDQTWLRRSVTRMVAMRILNERFSEVPAYWLSIPSLGKNRNGPTSDFYPCRHHTRGDRLYYGFMFREHRDAQYLLWPKAVKELTPES